jgi:hypothetical protein
VSNTNGAVADLPAEAPESPATPTLTDPQWQALAAAAAAVQQAESALGQAKAQWQLVWAATGIAGNWTIDPAKRTLTAMG